MRSNWHVILATHRHNVFLRGVHSLRLPLYDSGQLKREIESLAPDLIVHTAGLTNVEKCEQDSLQSYYANAEIARNVALVSNELGIKLAHISTDHLFTGEKPFLTEQAVPQPVNEYAHSKLLAEKYVSMLCPDALILRTNFFGWGHKWRQSFSDWIIYSLRSGESISLFEDVYITPIVADFLVKFTHELVSQKAEGIFNVVGGQRLSKYEFAISLAKEFDLPTELLLPTKVENMYFKAKRPKDMSLANNQLIRVLGRDVGNVEDFIHELRKQEEGGRREELYDSVFPIDL